jgi:hypothetical protein
MKSPCRRLGRVCMSKETYYSVKRDLLQCQKRPTTVSKETYCRRLVRVCTKIHQGRRAYLTGVIRPPLRGRIQVGIPPWTRLNPQRPFLLLGRRSARVPGEDLGIKDVDLVGSKDLISVKRDLLQCQKRPIKRKKDVDWHVRHHSLQERDSAVD